MIRLPEIKTAELSTYGNFAECPQAHFRVSRVGLGTRLIYRHVGVRLNCTTEGKLPHWHYIANLMSLLYELVNL